MGATKATRAREVTKLMRVPETIKVTKAPGPKTIEAAKSPGPRKKINKDTKDKSTVNDYKSK